MQPLGTYQNVSQDDQQASSDVVTVHRSRRNRRSFTGKERVIQPFKKSIHTAQFIIPHTTEAELDECKMRLKVLDFYWFWKLIDGDNPLHAGFVSKFIEDPLPLQKICYTDPISQSPTNNDVVRETMVRTMRVANETGQQYAVVTYDLQVALKAYSIQAIESPLFDKLLIMLGNFHIELAFFGAIGTLIKESGIEFILVEADILAEGSMMGFIEGKFYNRCTRIHELLANVLEKKLYERFLFENPEEDDSSLNEVMSTVPLDMKLVEKHLSHSVVTERMQKYEEFFESFLNGNLGSTARFWAIYIFLINRLHRQLQKCVKTNNVNGYIRVFPTML